MTWYLATEDQLSSTIASKLIQSVYPESEITADLGLTGNGKLKADLQSGKYSKLASQYHVLLLTDTDAFSSFSGVSKGKIPRDLEAVQNPKETLLDLVKKHGNRTSQIILPRKGSSSKISPSYNAVLCDFVRGKWSAERAAVKAPSLRRAMERVRGVV